MGQRTRNHRIALLAFILAAIAFPLTVQAADFSAAKQAMKDYNATREASQQLLTSGITTEEQQQQLETLQRQAKAQRHQLRLVFEAENVLQSKDLAALLQYADVLAAQNNYDLAAEALIKANEVNPAVPEQWRKLGQYLAKCGPNKRQAAYDALHRALRVKPEPLETVAINTALADLYIEDKLYEFAEEYASKALDSSPNAVYPTLLTACLRVRKGEVVEAEKAFTALGHSAAQYDLQTRVLLREIFLDFEAKGRWVADTAENHRALSHLYYRAARFLDAIMAARQATMLAPNDYETFNFAGQILLQTGSYPAALKTFQQSLAIKPDQPQIQKVMQQLQAQQEQPPQQPQPQQ